MLTNDSGVLSLPLLPAGGYRLNISAVGYSGKIVPLNVMDTTVAVNLGTILLVTESKGLAAITVTAPPPLVRQEIDRLAFDVQADRRAK